MFNIFKTDPAKKLQKLYEKKLEEAMQAQRNGNIELFAKLSVEAESLLKKLDEVTKDTEK